MFKKSFLAFILLLITFLTIYPSKKENTNLFDFCYSLEKILLKNYLEKNKKVSKKFKILAKDITLIGINKTKGSLAKRIIDQYKSSKKLFIVNFVPNQFFCLAGYWIEEVNPGAFSSIFYEKSKQKIKQYEDIKNEVDEFIMDINLEYESIKKEFKDLF